MKKILAIMALPLALASCNGGNISLPTAKVSIQPGFSVPGKVAITHNTKDGVYTGSTKEVTQPLIRFEAAAGSAGVTVTGYSLEVLDATGSLYNADGARISRDGLAYRVAPGYICSGVPVSISTGLLNDQCEGKYKVMQTRTTTLPSNDVALIRDNIANALIEDSATALFSSAANLREACPNLAIRVTFRGVDDAGNAWVSNPIRGDIATSCAVK